MSTAREAGHWSEVDEQDTKLSYTTLFLSRMFTFLTYMPLVDVLGVDNIRRSFSVGFDFIDSESEKNYPKKSALFTRRESSHR